LFIARDAKGNLVPVDEAISGEEYFCPTCGEKMRVRDGEINVKHYAHVSLNDCDDFSHDMSEWHKAWQEKFPIDCREVVVSDGKEHHRADILIGKFVIEFQHSPISVEEVMRRNIFYVRAGYKVIWVFDAVEPYDNEQIDVSDNDSAKYTWKYANKALSCIQPQNNKSVSVILQFTEAEDEELDPWLVMVDWAVPDGPDGANYRNFIIDDFFDPDLFTEDGLAAIMINKRGRFEKLLRENRPYKQKCGRVKGNPRDWYICEKTGDWHNGSCESCPHNLIREFRRGTQHYKGGLFFYCCYPRVMHDIGHSELPDHERTPTIRT